MIRTFIDLSLAEGDAATATCQEPGRGEEGR